MALVIKKSTCRRLCRKYQKCRFDLWIGKIRGGRNDNPLQYSCLENCMARGGWQPTVYGITNSLTRLRPHPYTNHYSFSFHSWQFVFTLCYVINLIIGLSVYEIHWSVSVCVFLFPFFSSFQLHNTYQVFLYEKFHCFSSRKFLTIYLSSNKFCFFFLRTL